MIHHWVGGGGGWGGGGGDQWGNWVYKKPYIDLLGYMAMIWEWNDCNLLGILN